MLNYFKINILSFYLYVFFKIFIPNMGERSYKKYFVTG